MVAVKGTCRWRLLAGASLLVLAAVKAGVPPALAACTTVSGDTSVVGNTGCVNWSGGTLSISGAGTIATTGPSEPAVTVSGSSGNLTNSGTIDSRFIGVSNLVAGTIGTLHNSGTIRGDNGAAGNGFTSAGINNSGTIGALINDAAGVIAGGSGGSDDTGISNNGGTIGALTNNGTISSAGSGIYTGSGGTITVLTNNGTISGNTQDGVVVYQGSVGTLVNNSGALIHGNNDAGILVLQGGIGVLTNAGTISSANVALNNSTNATIGVLTNSGTITSTLRAIENTGNIGTLTNSGTIRGPEAIANSGSGSFGTIVNTGVIAGSITNTATSNLSINGGDALHMGTLTGQSGGIGAGDKGTIANVNADVVFSSGHLLLNDNINVTGHAVRNTGATLRLDNTINITGAYRQTGGGLLATATNNGASYGHLVVSGDATVTNSTITISGAGLSAGQSYTIVDSSGTGTYTGDTAVVAVTNGLSAQINTVNNDLVVTLVGDTTNTYTAKGAAVGGVGTKVGTVLDKIRTDTSQTAQAFQNTVLAAIDSLPSSSQGEAMKQLTPVQNAPSAQMSNSASTAVLGAVEQHQQTAMAYSPETGVAAGADARNTALWGEFLGGGAIRGSTADSDGYKTHLFGMAVGLDNRFTDAAMGGVAVSWVRAWSAGQDNSSGSTTTLDSYQLTLYGTYRIDRAFVDGQLGAGWNEFDQTRAINFLNRQASAEYSGQQYVAKIKAGYDLSVGEALVTPMAGLSWSRAIFESYDEQGAGAANLSVDGRGSNTVTQDLGGKVSWTIATAHGQYKPEVRAAWVHDYTNGPIATSGLMGGQAFVTTTPRTEPNGVRVGLATTFNGNDEVSLRAEYEGEMRPHYQSHTGLLKAILGF